MVAVTWGMKPASWKITALSAPANGSGTTAVTCTGLTTVISVSAPSHAR